MKKPSRANPRTNNAANKQNLTLANIQPMTNNQATLLQADEHLLIHGCAGTGKSFLASYMALRDILTYQEYDKLIYLRSAVPSRDMGFLPGTDKEKAAVYEIPYRGIFSELFSRGDSYDMLKAKGVVEFMTTSFIRGTTFSNCAVVVDECQNMTYHELDSIITRIGDNCRVFFCGDMFQADLTKNGVKDFYNVIREMPQFTSIEFGLEDIVRSKLVKDYLTAKQKIHGNKVM